MSTTTTKPRYRVPTVSNYHDVRLDEFDISDIREYLQHMGESASGADPTSWDDIGGVLIETAEVQRIETLALCGQKEAAREWLLEIFSKAIGRPI